jgi:hypothetical protein
VVVQDSKDSKVGKGTRVMLEPEPKETLGFKVTKVGKVVEEVVAEPQ